MMPINSVTLLHHTCNPPAASQTMRDAFARCNIREKLTKRKSLSWTGKLSVVSLV